MLRGQNDLLTGCRIHVTQVLAQAVLCVLAGISAASVLASPLAFGLLAFALTLAFAFALAIPFRCICAIFLQGPAMLGSVTGFATVVAFALDLSFPFLGIGFLAVRVGGQDTAHVRTASCSCC